MRAAGRLRAFSVAVMVLALTACATQRAATELAATTGRNTTLLEGNLSALVRQQRAISETRIAIVSRLHRETVLAEALRDRLVAFERAENLGDPADLSERWRRQTEESARQYVAQKESLAAARKVLEEKQKAVQAPIGPLQDTSKALVALSRELTFKEHVAFLFTFFSEAGADVKKAQDDAKKAQEAGDDKAKKAEKSTKDDGTP
jgi:uncharacterized membrane protein YccC